MLERVLRVLASSISVPKSQYLASSFHYPFMLFPKIQTPRLELRQPRKEDLPRVFQGLSHPDVIRHYGVSYHTQEEAKVQMEFYDHLWRSETGIFWAITLLGQKELIGALGYNNYMPEVQKAEFNIWLLPNYQKQGLAAEAMSKVLQYGFSALDLHRVEALVETPNQAVKTLLAKFNFKHEGTLRETEFKNEQYIDLEMHALLKREATDLV